MKKIPVNIGSMENPHSTIHVLEKPWAGIRMLEDHCRSIKDQIKTNDMKARRAAEDTKKIISDLKENTSELDSILEFGFNELRHYWGLLRIDSLDHSNNKISMHKQVQKLKREEKKIIDNVAEQRQAVDNLEDQLFRT